MSQLPILEFSENWNNKLECSCFSTIRLHNPKKYYMGAKMQVEVKGHLKPNPAVVKYIVTFYLHQLTEGMALLDTGYDLAKSRKIIETMYKNKVMKLAEARFDFIILGYLKSETLIPTNQLSLL